MQYWPRNGDWNSYISSQFPQKIFAFQLRSLISKTPLWGNNPIKESKTKNIRFSLFGTLSQHTIDGVAYTLQEFIVHGSGDGKSEVTALTPAGADEGPRADHRLLTSHSLWSRVLEGARDLCGASLLKVVISFMKTPTSWLITSENLHLIRSPCQWGFQHMHFRERCKHSDCDRPYAQRCSSW